MESVASATQITFLIASLVMAFAIMLSLRLPSVHLRSTLNASPSDVP
jgi:hypothetical protein